MQDRKVYEYALIRVVPRVERGECLNVGVIVFCKSKKYLDMRVHLDEPRLKVFSANLDIAGIREHLQAWDLICKGDPSGGPISQLDQAGRFRWLTATRSTILQCSEVHPGLCTDPEAVLDDLFERYVL